jgi:hypothetical protein
MKGSTKQVKPWYITKRYIIYGAQEAELSNMVALLTVSQFMPLYSDYSRINFLIFGILVTLLLTAFGRKRQ